MQTSKVKQFYDTSLQMSENKYEFDRWHKTSQGRASYAATMYAMRKYALPLVNQGDSVLEVGPGPGTWTKVIIDHIGKSKYDIVDISEQMLRQAKDNLGQETHVDFIHSDVMDFTPMQKYDFFFSSRFIEYVPDKKSVVEVIHSSLRNNGCGYVVTKTPQYSRPFSKKLNSEMHQHQISAQDFKVLLKDNGFSVIAIKNVTSVFPGIRSGLADRILTFVSRYLPYQLTKYWSESYAITFKKNDI